MIHPILGFGIAGAIWYQGESNAARAAQYNQSFPMMISDWRKRWQEEFPFYFVQLTNYDANGGTSQNGGSNWAELREAQHNTLKLPNTGMAVITDIGNPKDIHPRNKQDVGKRLAWQALDRTYGIETPWESPTFASMEVKDGKAFISFKDTYGGLTARDRYGYVKGFEVAGPDRKFVYAKAYLSDGRVVVHADGVAVPTAVRYGWADDVSDMNLFNGIGLPAAPFRTDDWPRKTADAGFGK
jgi:sialate O-acetylesterase